MRLLSEPFQAKGSPQDSRGGGPSYQGTPKAQRYSSEFDLEDLELQRMLIAFRLSPRSLIEMIDRTVARTFIQRPWSIFPNLSWFFSKEYLV